MWASTHNDTLREKMTMVVDILDSCQKKMGTGYLSAYPETVFDLYEQLFDPWSPYYTIHKVCIYQFSLSLFHARFNLVCDLISSVSVRSFIICRCQLRDVTLSFF